MAAETNIHFAQNSIDLVSALLSGCLFQIAHLLPKHIGLKSPPTDHADFRKLGGQKPFCVVVGEVFSRSSASMINPTHCCTPLWNSANHCSAPRALKLQRR